MAYPTVEIPWQYSLNNLAENNQSSTAEDVGTSMIKLVDVLTGIPVSPWEVWGSCGYDNPGWTFGNGDGVNNWTDALHVQRGTGAAARAWMVLTQPGINSGDTALCIEYSGSANGYFAFVLSPVNGFGAANGGVDGTSTARPTATDEIVLGTSLGCGTAPGGQQTWWHVLQSTTGKQTRIFATRGGAVTCFAFVDVPKRPVSGWANPVCAGWLGDAGAATSVAVAANLVGTAFVAGRATAPLGATANFTAYLTTEAAASVMMQTRVVAPSDMEAALDGTGPVPIISCLGMYSTSYGYRGKVADGLHDLWFGQAVGGPNTGDQFPLSGDVTFTAFDEIVVPTPNTTIRIA